jgi:hypothetical protein
MKKQVGIWIDTKKAIIVTLEGQNEAEIKEIDSDVENRIYHHKEGDKGTFSGNQHIDNESKFDNRITHQMDSYLDAVLEHIQNSDSLYIFGPAEAKVKLEQRFLDIKAIDKINLKAVETADSMTLNQVVAQVKNFYNPV